MGALIAAIAVGIAACFALPPMLSAGLGVLGSVQAEKAMREAAEMQRRRAMLTPVEQREDA